MTEYKRETTFKTKNGYDLEITNPTLSYENMPTNGDIQEAFGEIDWDETKLTELDNGHIIYVIALKVIKTKFGAVLYCMDYNKHIWKLNKSAYEWFKKYKPSQLNKCKNINLDKDSLIVSTTKEPLCCCYITGDGEYKGYDFKHLEIDWSHTDLKTFNVKIQKDLDKKTLSFD